MTGRPKIKLDLAVVKKLCSLHCTGEEIASVLDVSYDTLERRIKELGYNSFSLGFQQREKLASDASNMN